MINRHGLNITKYQERLQSISNKMVLMDKDRLHGELMRVIIDLENPNEGNCPEPEVKPSCDTQTGRRRGDA